MVSVAHLALCSRRDSDGGRDAGGGEFWPEAGVQCDTKCGGAGKDLPPDSSAFPVAALPSG